MSMTNWRPTPVQQDVLDRLREGATIEDGYGLTYVLRKDGEPNRHVSWNTVHSLIRRNLLRGVSPSPIGPNGSFRWTLAQ